MRQLNHKYILLILVIISIWSIASIELEILPLIPTSFSTEFAAKLNRMLISLAYSFFAAYIFYIVTIVLPRRMLILRGKKILAQQVHTLLYKMFVMINQILFIFDVQKDILDVEEKDLLPVDGDTTKKYKGFYGTSEHWNNWRKKGERFTGFGSMDFEYPANVVRALTEIPTLIHEIRASNPNFHVDEEFAEILSSIETSKIIEWYAEGKKPIFLFSHSHTYLFKLIYDYRRLLKKGYNRIYKDSYHKIHIYTEEECKMVPIERAKWRDVASSHTSKMLSLLPYIVYNNTSNTSKSIVAYLNRGYIMNEKGEKTGKLYTISPIQKAINIDDSCKCIIIITEQISQKQINDLKNKNIDKLIILLSPSIIRTTKQGCFTKNTSSKNEYKIYYRTEFSLLGFKISSKYPTRQVISSISANINDILNSIC